MTIGEIMRNLKVIMLAIVALPVWAHAQTLGICDKKPQVRDAIMQALGAEDCASVDSSSLGSLTLLASGNERLATSMGAEGGLFIPLSAADAAHLPSALVSQEPFLDAQSGAGPAAPANGWLVRIDRQRLFRTIHGVAERGSGRLLLNLADGPEFDVVVERTRRTLSGHSLSGRVENVAGSAVTMVAHAEAVAGTVWTPGAAWELVPLQDGVHVFRKVDFSARLPLGEPIRAQDGWGEFRSIDPANLAPSTEFAPLLELGTATDHRHSGNLPFGYLARATTMPATLAWIHCCALSTAPVRGTADVFH